METTIISIIGTKKGLNILKMSRKVFKNWGRPFSHTFQAKIVEASPLFSPTAPLPLLMTGPLDYCRKHPIT
jgi:hypothetical protein